MGDTIQSITMTFCPKQGFSHVVAINVFHLAKHSHIHWKKRKEVLKSLCGEGGRRVFFINSLVELFSLYVTTLKDKYDVNF